MSYILDALKKIEQEKSIRSRSSAGVSITGDLFRENKRHKTGNNIWLTMFMVAVVALIAGAGTWYFVRSSKSTAVNPVISVQKMESTKPVDSHQSVINKPVITAPVTPEINGSSQNIRTISSSGELKSPQKISPMRKANDNRNLTKIPVPPGIVLSGIAWQDERSGRRAVINGQLLKEGVIVSGAKIEEIDAAGVRFSTAGGIFDIKLDTAPHGEVTK